MPTTVDRVKTWLHLPLADTADDPLVQDCVDAVNGWVGRLPWIAALSDPLLWGDQADQGATMLAARLYRRRNTPSGVEGMGDAVVYLPRRDSDVDMLLRVGSYAMPTVG